MAEELMLEKGMRFALSDEAIKILQTEGLEAYKKAMKERGISKNAKGGEVRAMKDGGRALKGTKFKGTF